MTGLPPHRTRRGLDFGLRRVRVALPDTAPYWQYVIDVRLPSGAGRGFTVLIRKAAYPTKAAADAFLLADPLAEVKAQLEQADDEGIPLIWPSQRDDWFMF